MCELLVKDWLEIMQWTILFMLIFFVGMIAGMVKK